jgi:hypothetical protein
MAPLAPTVMTIIGAVFHPCRSISSISGLYFVSLSIIFSEENLPLQYVNSTNCMVTSYIGCCGEGLLCVQVVYLVLVWRYTGMVLYDRCMVVAMVGPSCLEVCCFFVLRLLM